MVTLDSSDAKIPRPRVEMYLAVARSSSSKGLAVGRAARMGERRAEEALRPQDA